MPTSRNKETQLTPTNTGRTEQSTLSIRMETPKYSILYVFKALNAVSGHITVTLSLHKQKMTFRVLQVKKELHLQRDEVLNHSEPGVIHFRGLSNFGVRTVTTSKSHQTGHLQVRGVTNYSYNYYKHSGSSEDEWLPYHWVLIQAGIIFRDADL